MLFANIRTMKILDGERTRAESVNRNAHSSLLKRDREREYILIPILNYISITGKSLCSRKTRSPECTCSLVDLELYVFLTPFAVHSNYTCDVRDYTQELAFFMQNTIGFRFLYLKLVQNFFEVFFLSRGSLVNSINIELYQHRTLSEYNSISIELDQHRTRSTQNSIDVYIYIE